MKIIDTKTISGVDQAFEVEINPGYSKVYFVTSTGISHHPDFKHINWCLKDYGSFHGYLEIESFAIPTLDMLLNCEELEDWMRNHLFKCSKSWGMQPQYLANPVKVNCTKINYKRIEEKKMKKSMQKLKKLITENMETYVIKGRESFGLNMDFEILESKDLMIMGQGRKNKDNFGYIKRKFR